MRLYVYMLYLLQALQYNTESQPHLSIHDSSDLSDWRFWRFSRNPSCQVGELARDGKAFGFRGLDSLLHEITGRILSTSENLLTLGFRTTGSHLPCCEALS